MGVLDIDPAAAQQRLDNTEGMSPNQRRAAQEEINEARAWYEQQGLKFVEERERYVTDTSARITNTYATCRTGYEEFAQWLRDTEPTAKEARKRLDSLHREELNMNRLTEGVSRAAEDAERVKADPVGFMTSLRKKYNL
ncbi:hypothetical protein [Kribbella sp. DT2]|uniref:hypothetical protein n=1 Tax=Kribbella sp. DT2 TaxID=3393427 RepID=UPI003CE8D26C